MATEVGALYYDLDVDDKKLHKGLDRAESKMGKFGAGLAKLGKLAAVGIAAAGAAAVAFGVSAVKAFSEAQDVAAQTNAVLKSTGGVAGVTADQVNKLASSLQNVTKFSDETIKGGQNLLLTFTKIGKDVFPEATEIMLDMSQALGQDLKSSAVQLGKALQDPIMGVTALRRVGVNFSEDQQKVIKNLVDTGKSAEAQRLILKELQTEFGGSARAAGETLSGKLEILKNKFNDLQETIGETIVNYLTPFATKAIDALQAIDWQHVLKNTTDALKELWAWLQKAWDQIYALYQIVNTAFGPSLRALYDTVATELVPTLKRLADVLGPILIPYIRLLVQITTGVWLASWWLVINVLNILLNVFSRVIDIISSVINWLKNFVKTVGALFSANTLPSLIRLGVAGIYNILIEPFKKAYDFIKGIVDKIKGVVSTITGAGGGALSSIIKGVIPGLASGVENFGGGLAYVHKGEVLANLPKGTDVIPADKAGGIGGGGSLTVNIGTINDRSDADYILREIDRKFERVNMGISP